MLFNSSHTLRFYRLLVITALLVLPIHSWALNIALVYNEDSGYQQSFMAEFVTQASSHNKLNITKMPAASLSISALKNKRFDAIVNLDNATGEKLMVSNLATNTFHALTTLARARSFAPCLPKCSKSLPRHRFFVLDQPPARQLRLIQLISPSLTNIGVIVTNKSVTQLKPLIRFAKQHKLTISEHITNSDNMRYQIDDVSKSSDVILAVADTDIYNVSSLSQILLTSYRYRTPIIGFSKGFIKAGAIAGVVSNMQQLTKHLIESLASPEVLKKNLSNVVHPKYFNVITNRNVAKSLNLHFATDDELKKQLTSYEAAR